MDNITLVIRGQEFTASKANLSEYSDYFRAMFSGSYVENDQTRVNIDVFDPNIMSIILQYIRIGLIDLSEYSLDTIGELSEAASFLQVTELMKQIEYTLDIQLSENNWIKTMAIAVAGSYKKLEQLAAAHGLLSFKRMKPEYIPTIQKLFWYLSHPYIDAENEFQVFKFGHEWITQNQRGGDALLLVLCCLDYKKITIYDLHYMMALLGNYTNSLAEKVIECLHEHAEEERQFTISYFTSRKSRICKKYTERVYREVMDLLKESITRKLVLTPAVPMWVMKDSKPEVVPHYLYTYTKETDFQRWLEVADKNLWGWSVVAWGLMKVVVACGEHGRGTGIFMRDIKVYDTLRNEWTQHGVSLPCRRHAGLAVLGDLLYMVGGVGGYRVVLDSAIVYDLKMRTSRKICNFPEAIQNPAVCTHNNAIYASGQKQVYRYEDTGSSDRWTMVKDSDIRASCMISYKGYIHCGQSCFCHLYRFKPDDNERLEMVAQLNCPPATLCHIGDRLIVFSRTMCGHADIMAVEEYNEDNYVDDQPKILWLETQSKLKINDVGGSCVVAMTIPPMNNVVSQTHLRHLSRFSEE